MICIVCRNPYTYPVTFIRAHIKHLPGSIQVLHGGIFPRFYGEQETLEPQHFLYRLYRKIAVSVCNVPSETFERQGLTRFLIKNGVDVVLAEMAEIGAAVLPSVRAAHKPLIVYFRGNDPSSNPELAKISYPELFHYAAALFVVSRDLERQLLDLGAPKHKLFYNPSGVDISLFQGAKPAEAPPNFLSVGRFVDKKGPQLTILAFKRVTEVVPAARLLMIGEGNLWESCKLLVKSLKLTESVEFLGYQPHERVAEIMGKEVRAVVQHSIQTSYGGVEGTPCAVLEAGASGLPVVATRHAGIVDAVVHGTTGFLVEEGDIEGMAQHMIRLALEPDLARRLGSAARERIRAEFPMEKSINRLWMQIKAHIKS